MNVSETISLNNSINTLLQGKLSTSLIFKLYKIQQELKPVLEIAVETLDKIRLDNQDEPDVNDIVKKEENRILREPSNLTLKPSVLLSELPEEMDGHVLVALIPVILEEENEK